MDVYSPEDVSSPGYSIPIRAPLTIDSDSDFNLPINGQIYSRTSSFNSSSSIDISSYSDEHTSNLEEENEGFLAYPDEEIVIERSHIEVSSSNRPFVRYPDANFSESTIFRPFVKIPCEESSSVDVGTKFSVPVARLTRECDSDTDIDSLDGSRWDDSGWIPDDGSVQKVAMAPKVRSFSGDDNVDDELQVECVFSGDDNLDMTGTENLDSVSTESVENEGCEVECLNEEIESLNFVSTEAVENEGCKVECLNAVLKLSESDVSSLDLERTDAQTVSSSNNEIETETVNEKVSESDELIFDSERIDAQVVSNSDSEIENLNSVSTESVKHEGCEVEYLNEVVKASEVDVSSFDFEIIDARIVSSSNNDIEIETINEKLSEPDEPSFDSDIIDTQIVSISDSEIEIETENINETEEEMLQKMQRVRAKFLRLALSKQLTKKVNGEGGNYKFDFDLTVLVIGKTGVGKSATINSIFGENKVITSAFDPGTTSIQEITGNVNGIQLRVIDTPGLKCSSLDQSYNLRILKSIKRFTRKHTPNVVLYVDRLDTRDIINSQLLKLITGSLGSSVWHSCIIALTHASCDPSGGFVVQRCRFVQEQIVSCGGDVQRMANPVWLVENHPSYKHDIMDLDCDQANEDDGCDRVPSSEPLSEPRDVINHSVERKKVYFTEHSYHVKLVGTNHWSLGCRLCI